MASCLFAKSHTTRTPKPDDAKIHRKTRGGQGSNTETWRACTQVPTNPWGIRLSQTLRVSVSLPCPPRVFLRILALSGFGVLVVWILAKRKEAKAPTLPKSSAPWSSPPATRPFPSCSDYPATPSLTPSSSPPYHHYRIPGGRRSEVIIAIS